MTKKEALFKPRKSTKRNLRRLGLSPKDFDPKLQPEFVSTGIFNLMVRCAIVRAGKIVHEHDELRRLRAKTQPCVLLRLSGMAKPSPAACCHGTE